MTRRPPPMQSYSAKALAPVPASVEHVLATVTAWRGSDGTLASPEVWGLGVKSQVRLPTTTTTTTEVETSSLTLFQIQNVVDEVPPRAMETGIEAQPAHAAALLEALRHSAGHPAPSARLPTDHPAWTLADVAVNEGLVTHSFHRRSRRLVEVGTKAGTEWGLGSTTTISAFANSPVLITGGSGYLAELMARYVVRNGCTRVALVSRTGHTAPHLPPPRPLPPTLAPDPVLTTVVAGDVAQSGVLTALLAGNGVLYDWTGTHAKVLHAAGSLADGTLKSSTPSALRRAMAPKVIPGWDDWLVMSRLHGAVLFTSAAAWLGSPGQGAYAAANAGADAWASSLARGGNPVAAVAWGPWAGKGWLASSRGLASRLHRAGLGFLEPAEGLIALRHVLEAVVVGCPRRGYPPLTSCSAVTIIDGALLASSNPVAATLLPPFVPSIASLSRQSNPNDDDDDDHHETAPTVPSGSKSIQSSSSVEGVDQIQDRILRMAAHVVGMNQDAVSVLKPDIPWLASGLLDSLGAAEMVAGLKSSYPDAQLSPVDLFNYPTAHLLAIEVHERLRVHASGSAIASEERLGKNRPPGADRLMEISSAGSTPRVYVASVVPPPTPVDVCTTPSAVLRVVDVVYEDPTTSCLELACSNLAIDGIRRTGASLWDPDRVSLVADLPLPPRFAGWLPGLGAGAGIEVDVDLFGFSSQEVALLEPQQRWILNQAATVVARRRQRYR